MSTDMSGIYRVTPKIPTNVPIQVSTTDKYFVLTSNLQWENIANIVNEHRSQHVDIENGRPLDLRLHLGAVITQQITGFVDRDTEDMVRNEYSKISKSTWTELHRRDKPRNCSFCKIKRIYWKRNDLFRHNCTRSTDCPSNGSRTSKEYRKKIIRNCERNETRSGQCTSTITPKSDRNFHRDPIIYKGTEGRHYYKKETAGPKSSRCDYSNAQLRRRSSKWCSNKSKRNICGRFAFVSQNIRSNKSVVRYGKASLWENNQFMVQNCKGDLTAQSGENRRIWKTLDSFITPKRLRHRGPLPKIGWRWPQKSRIIGVEWDKEFHFQEGFTKNGYRSRDIRGGQAREGPIRSDHSCDKGKKIRVQQTEGTVGPCGHIGGKFNEVGIGFEVRNGICCYANSIIGEVSPKYGSFDEIPQACGLSGHVTVAKHSFATVTK